MMRKTILLVVLGFAFNAAGAAEQNPRRLVKLPQMMQSHMLSNMRDHLQAVHEIQAALSKGEPDRAADIAEARLGMSSLAAHNASHMAPYMPKAMQEIGTEMHHAASRFALTAKEGDLTRTLGDLAKVTQQCIACHAAYRIR
jgi:hypothetical protein